MNIWWEVLLLTTPMITHDGSFKLIEFCKIYLLVHMILFIPWISFQIRITHLNFRQLFIRLKLRFVNFIWHVKEERMNFKIFNILKSRQYGIPFLKINKSWKLGFPHLSCLRDISSELGRNLYSRRVFLLEPFNLNWKILV